MCPVVSGRRSEGRERPGQAVPDEARAEAHGDVVPPRVELDLRCIPFDDLDAVVQSRLCNAGAGIGRKLSGTLDAGDSAAKRRGEEDRRDAFAARDVEDVRLRRQPKALAE
jgi:hypothetical protein